MTLKMVKAPHIPKMKDLTQEIERAMRKKEGASGFLKVIEGAERLTGSTTYPEPPGWDSEF
jgi:hypothetical protein